MRDEPTVEDLLDAARESLLENVLPTIPDPGRREVLMIANALAIVRRICAAGEGPLRCELRALEALYHLVPEVKLHGAALSTKLHELNSRLVQDIRAGSFDSQGPDRDAAELHLMNGVVQKLRESRPKMLKAEGIE